MKDQKGLLMGFEEVFFELEGRKKPLAIQLEWLIFF
jgi:hypothetical protein